MLEPTPTSSFFFFFPPRGVFGNINGEFTIIAAALAPMIAPAVTCTGKCDPSIIRDAAMKDAPSAVTTKIDVRNVALAIGGIFK